MHYNQINTCSTMKTSWEKSIYVIFVPIYILSLYLAINVPHDVLWPFVMLNIGALTGIPNIVNKLRNRRGCKAETTQNENDIPTTSRKYWAYLLAYVSAALLISLAIDMFWDKKNNIEYVGVLVIFASIFVVLVITDLILVAIPARKKAKEIKSIEKME